MRLFVRIRYNLKNIVMNHLDGVWLFPVEKPWKRQKAAQLPSGSLQLSYGSIWLQKTRKFRSISSIFAASKKRCDPAKTPDFSDQCFYFISWKNALFMLAFTILIIEFGSVVLSNICAPLPFILRTLGRGYGPRYRDLFLHCRDRGEISDNRPFLGDVYYGTHWNQNLYKAVTAANSLPNEFVNRWETQAISQSLLSRITVGKTAISKVSAFTCELNPK